MLANLGEGGLTNNSVAIAINASGQVVGDLDFADGSAHAALWQNGTLTDLRTLGGSSSYATGINDAGQVVGWSYLSDNVTFHAFLWQNGIMTDLGSLAGSGSFSHAYGINNNGQIVGDTAVAGVAAFHPFLWQNGVMTDLGTLGGNFASARAINDSGQVAGDSDVTSNPAGPHNCFLWQNGTMTSIGTLSTASSNACEANGINSLGQIVGQVGYTSGCCTSASSGFLWKNGMMTDLGPIFGSIYVVATAIADPNFLVDPVPDLLNGPAVVKPTDQIGSLTGAQLLATKGRLVQGVAADGVAQVVVRIPAGNVGDQFTLTLLNDQQPPTQSRLPDEDGALGNPGDTSFSQSQVTVSAVATGNGPNGQPNPPFAFAVYRAPKDFVRLLSSGGFKSGVCNGAQKTDDQLGCRSVSIQVQGPSGNVTLQITIARPPVILIHGLWADSPTSTSWTWNNFAPLFALGVSDRRFFVATADYNQPLQLDITATDPADAPAAINANAMGFIFNAGSVLRRIGNLVNFFKDENPAGVPLAAVRADIVAHSMGGDIVRTLPLFANFLARETLGQGSVHKLITIDTPHLGSPLASQLLDPTNTCIRRQLANAGLVSLNSVTISATLVLSGALGDLSPGSSMLARIASGPPTVPTAMIAGIALGPNLAGLDASQSNANRLHKYCSSDPLAQRLTSMAWPTVFSQFNGETYSDAVVGLGSQLNSPPNPGSTTGFQFSGYIHTRGLLDLGFVGPSVVDRDVVSPQVVSIPNQVINLLNTPVNQLAFSLLAP